VGARLLRCEARRGSLSTRPVTHHHSLRSRPEQTSPRSPRRSSRAPSRGCDLLHNPEPRLGARPDAPPGHDGGTQHLRIWRSRPRHERPGQVGPPLAASDARLRAPSSSSAAISAVPRSPALTTITSAPAPRALHGCRREAAARRQITIRGMSRADWTSWLVTVASSPRSLNPTRRVCRRRPPRGRSDRVVRPARCRFVRDGVGIGAPAMGAGAARLAGESLDSPPACAGPLPCDGHGHLQGHDRGRPVGCACVMAGLIIMHPRRPRHSPLLDSWTSHALFGGGCEPAALALTEGIGPMRTPRVLHARLEDGVRAGRGSALVAHARATRSGSPPSGLVGRPALPLRRAAPGGE